MKVLKWALLIVIASAATLALVDVVWVLRGGKLTYVYFTIGSSH